MIYCVYAIDWTEYERGWGQRPDGTSYYKTKEKAEKAIADWRIREKESNPSGVAPDIYTSPNTPYLTEVPKEVYTKVQKSRTKAVWKTT